MISKIKELLVLPIIVTIAGAILHFMDWLTVFRLTQKSEWTEAMEFRLISNQFTASVLLIAAIGIFVVRTRCKAKVCLMGCGLLTAWGVLSFAVNQMFPSMSIVQIFVGLPVRLFDFITQYLKLFGIQGAAFALALPSILAPFIFALFLVGRKQTTKS